MRARPCWGPEPVWEDTQPGIAPPSGGLDLEFACGAEQAPPPVRQPAASSAAARRAPSPEPVPRPARKPVSRLVDWLRLFSRLEPLRS